MDNLKKLQELKNNKIDITLFYNHEKFLKSAEHGMRIIQNTDFTKYENARLQAIKNFNIGDFIQCNNGMQAIICKIDKDILIIANLLNFTKNGKFKKNCFTTFENPCHVSKIDNFKLYDKFKNINFRLDTIENL